VLGTETDLSELTIALPLAMPSSTYNVFVTTQGATQIRAFDVANASKTAADFVLSATADFQAGDVIGFLVIPLEP